jgi:hypothetical protein
MTQVLFGKLQMPYWVLEFWGDYEQALVYRCVQVGPFKQEFVHFLSRDAVVPDEIRLEMARYATGVGLNMSFVRPVPMDSCSGPAPAVDDDIPDVSAVRRLQVHADPLVATNCTGDDGNLTDCLEYLANYTENSTESVLPSSSEDSNDIPSIITADLPSTSQLPRPSPTTGANKTRPSTQAQLVPSVPGPPGPDCPATVNIGNISINSSVTDKMKRTRWFGSYNKTPIAPDPVRHGGRPVYSGPNHFYLYYGSEQGQWMIGLNISPHGVELEPWVTGLTGLNKDMLCPEPTKHWKDNMAKEEAEAKGASPEIIMKDIKKQMKDIKRQLEQLEDRISSPRPSPEVAPVRTVLQDSLDGIINISVLPEGPEVAPARRPSRRKLDNTIARTRSHMGGKSAKKHYVESGVQSS